MIEFNKFADPDPHGSALKKAFWIRRDRCGYGSGLFWRVAGAGVFDCVLIFFSRSTRTRSSRMMRTSSSRRTRRRTSRMNMRSRRMRSRSRAKRTKSSRMTRNIRRKSRTRTRRRTRKRIRRTTKIE